MLSIQLLGKNFIAEDEKELFKQLKKANITISKTSFNKLIKTEKPPTSYLVNKKTKEVVKLDTTKDNKPLLKKEFGILKKDIGNKLKNLNYADLNKQYKITQRLPKNSKINVIINITFKYKISKDIRQTNKSYFYKGANNISVINDFVENKINDYLQNAEIENVFDVSYDVVSQYSKATMDFNGMVLREQNIIRIFNEDLENVIPPDGENCVKYYLNNTIKGLKRKLKDIEEPTINDLKEFCSKNKICFRCYDINRKLVSSNIIKYSKCKSINIVAWNNHIYPIKNLYFKKENKQNKLTFIYKENINNELINYLDNGKLPVKVSTAGQATISYFITEDNKVYSNNDEYETCLKVATLFGIQDKIDYTTTLISLGNTILNLYKKNNINSYWLNSGDFIKAGYNYSAEIDKAELNINMKKIKTIDKNKCYSYLLRNLPFLVKYDFQKNKPVDLKNHTIEDHFMYIVQPVESSILIPNTNVYFGSLIKFAKKQGIKFKILEGMETSKEENCFKEMIDDLYEKCPSIAKDIINRMIGTFNLGAKAPEDMIIFEKICNNDECIRSEGYVFKLNEKYNILYNKKTTLPRLGTKKPIAFQILDESRIMIYKKMVELGLEDKDIIKVKTDSISFLDKDLNINTGNGFNDWKEEEYKYMKFVNCCDNPIDLMTFKRQIYIDGQTTKLILGNAGCGKSYDIMHNLIPKLTKNYLILAPTNSTMAEYKINNFNVKVKQTFTFLNTIPNEDIVIIDEVGMSDDADFKVIVKCILAGKDVYAYGDFSQLLPVGVTEQKDGKFIIDMLFGEVVYMKTNYRNKFTSKYYDDLRYNYNKTELIKEVKKYSTKWTDAEFIIAYYKDTRDKYNKMKMEHLGFKSIQDVGCKVICKSNDLREKGIYNRYRCEVIDNTNNEIIIKDKLNTYHINKETYDKYFEPAYALTLYCVQGESINSYYYPNEDFQKINGRTAYTLISRLKQ